MKIFKAFIATITAASTLVGAWELDLQRRQCFTNLGFQSVQSIPTSTVRRTVTYKVTGVRTVTPTVTSTPSATLTSTTTLRVNATASQLTDTRTSTAVVSTTQTVTSTVIRSQTNTATVTTTSSGATVTVPTSAGFIPIASNPSVIAQGGQKSATATNRRRAADFVRGAGSAERRDAELAARGLPSTPNLTCQNPANGLKQPVSSLKPVSVTCYVYEADFVFSRETRTASPPKTVTAKTTVTSVATSTVIATSTIVPVNATQVITTTATSTVLSTTTSSGSTTVTTTTTTTSVQPAATVYDQCAPNNMLSAWGNYVVSGASLPQDVAVYAPGVASATGCCQACALRTGCTGYYFGIGGAYCYLFTSDSCAPTHEGWSFYGAPGANELVVIGNGQCGQGHDSVATLPS